MILLLQLLVTLALSVLYAININFNFALIEIFRVVLAFLVLNLAAVIVVLITFVLLIYISEKFPKNSLWKHKSMHYFNKYIFNFLYRVKPIIIGKENLPKDNNFVVYSNHIEYTDPLYIKQAFKDYPLAYVSKEELFKIPVMKNILRGTGCIPLSRKAGDRQALQAILEAIKAIKSGQPFGIFPEGTRSHSNSVAEFKSGSFKLAQKAGADIVPVVLYNMHKTVDFIKFIRARVYVKILPVIKYKDYKDMETNDLSLKVHQLIADELERFKSRSF